MKAITSVSFVTTKEQEHDRKHGAGGVKKLASGQVHENNAQEIHRHLAIAKSRQELVNFPGISKDNILWTISYYGLRHNQNMNPRKLLRRIKKAA